MRAHAWRCRTGVPLAPDITTGSLPCTALMARWQHPLVGRCAPHHACTAGAHAPVSSSASPSLPLQVRTSDTPMPRVVGTAANRVRPAANSLGWSGMARKAKPRQGVTNRMLQWGGEQRGGKGAVGCGNAGWVHASSEGRGRAGALGAPLHQAAWPPGPSCAAILRLHSQQCETCASAAAQRTANAPSPPRPPPPDQAVGHAQLVLQGRRYVLSLENEAADQEDLLKGEGQGRRGAGFKGAGEQGLGAGGSSSVQRRPGHLPDEPNAVRVAAAAAVPAAAARDDGDRPLTMMMFTSWITCTEPSMICRMGCPQGGDGGGEAGGAHSRHPKAGKPPC